MKTLSEEEQLSNVPEDQEEEYILFDVEMNISNISLNLLDMLKEIDSLDLQDAFKDSYSKKVEMKKKIFHLFNHYLDLLEPDGE